ncbi:MAG: hypothetical protein U0Q22_08660 [Acidimicrobiales bacterium]
MSTGPVTVPTSRARVYPLPLREGLRQLRQSYDWQKGVRSASTHYLDRELPITLLTITGTGDFPGIVPMLTGFLSRVGRPQSILVVDDGTLGPGERDCIRSISPLVEFYTPPIDLESVGGPEMAYYASIRPMGRKLAALVDLTSNGERPVLYADTDVWFSAASEPLVELLTSPIDTPWYMHDHSSTSLDSRVLPEPLPHVNSGFLILPKHLDWSDALAQSLDLVADPEWFTEQTVVHRAIHQHGARAFPPDKFILRWDDQHSPGDIANVAGVAVRHYVTPVRHKYWVMVHGGYARSARAITMHMLRRSDRVDGPS